MPELPEVETMVRGIRPHIEGRRIKRVLQCPCERKPILLEPSFEELCGRTEGQRIDRVWRRAKRVVMTLGSGDAFVIEPRMTGLMLLEDPPSADHLRIEWQLTGRSDYRSVWFWDRRGLGTVRLLDPDQQEQVLGLSSLGRDALETTADHWSEICSSSPTPIKVLMLNQKKIAGIGNLYASEILHLSRIHPETPARKLSRQKLARIAENTIAVLELAIRYEGSTLSDGTYRNALNKAGGYQNAHRVYDREGELCPTCQRSKIVRIVQSQRSTFFCRRCQPRPRC
ncbi:MAG: bifunctional DNA-formamidopyrimidine glycosylase/DNA-(apurinic or apyrimidinic site) lyase [Planctomycetota bacterium]|jgi:formamidopyrimidine-DNA glycosylase